MLLGWLGMAWNTVVVVVEDAPPGRCVFVQKHRVELL